MYDGDQTTFKVLWTQEANEECEKVMNRNAFFVNTSGKFIRYVELEAIQTFYNMTKEPTNNSRTISMVDTFTLCDLNSNEITFDNIVDLFGYLEHKDGTYPRFYPDDKMTIPVGKYDDNKEKIETTVGRFIFNKIILQSPGLSKELGFINKELTEGEFFSLERKIGDYLLAGKFNTDQMYKYVDTRDWLSLQAHVLITPSFTPDTVKIHPDVQKLKDELFEQYKKELEAGDAAITEMIEKKLIEKTKEVFKDDPGMELYNSGARGSLKNNYKNIALMRGAVYNRATGKFEVVQNSLNDGLAIKDIPISSNTILEGAYPKACGTRDSGYIAKKLLAQCQTEILDDAGSDCGTKRGIKIRLTDKNYKSYIHRYIMVNKKPLLLTDDNIKSYVNNVVELRTPMTCIKTEKGCMCNICAGNYYYMLGNKSIGLSASRIGNDLTRLNMKKFHDNVIKFSTIDPKNMFI